MSCHYLNEHEFDCRHPYNRHHHKCKGRDCPHGMWGKTLEQQIESVQVVVDDLQWAYFKDHGQKLRV